MEEKKEHHHGHFSHEHHETEGHEHHEKVEKHKHHYEAPKEEPKHHSAASKKDNLPSIFLALIIILGIILAINLALTFSLNKNIAEKTEAAKENSKPAKIEFTVIKNSKCSDCYDISAVSDHLKGSGIEVIKESSIELDSSEGRSLASKYGIERVPAVILTGEIEKAAIEGLQKRGDALVFSQPQPPYTEAPTGKIVGRVKLITLKDSSCKDCSNLMLLITGIKNSGIRIVDEKTIDVSSDDGKTLSKKYDIGFVPTIILSGDAGHYSLISQAWSNIGTKEDDGSYVMRVATPPYINLTTGKLRGMVNAVYLDDKSCAQCYNVTVHSKILGEKGMGVKFVNEETIDAGSSKGKGLIAKYNITKVPTIILSGEISAYPSSAGLIQFFSIEKDGYYVFRSLEAVGAYKDLVSNTVVKAQEQSVQ